MKPVHPAAAAIHFNKYPLNSGDRQLMNLGEQWITSENLEPFGGLASNATFQCVYA